MIDLVPADPPPTHEGRTSITSASASTRPTGGRRTLASREGVEVLGEPTERYGARGMGPSVYVLDPDGNIVELKQKPR